VDAETLTELLDKVLTIDGRGARKKAQYLLYIVSEAKREDIVAELTRRAYGAIVSRQNSPWPAETAATARQTRI
jgi:hypothetical protein